jgi:PAS domain S-box-containing protein
LNRIFGISSRESYSSYLSHAQYIDEADRPRVRRSVFTALREGAEWECEFRIRRPDETMRWLLVRGDLVRDEEGRPLQMVGAATDITARRQAEAERERIERKMQDAQKLESLGVLAGGIAHDFNNLLTGIIGHAGLALRGDLPGARSRLVQITSIAQRAAELCQQMLAYAGKGQFSVSSLNLSQLIKETAALMQMSISKQAVMTFEVAPKLPPVLADATQLRQIIINLVMNASEALGPEGGQIVLRTSAMKATRSDFHDARTCPDDPAGDYVVMEVSDTGCGMSRDTLARIFDPFFSTKFTGRGLGLASVLGIVRAHGGALFVRSFPGRGTTFRVLLPQSPAAAEGADDAKEEWTTDLRGAGTILVVDDEEMVRSIAVALVETAGYTAVEACGGRKALDLFGAEPERFAAVLLDVTMPGIDGIGVMTGLRAIRADVPVVLMSGYSELEIASRCSHPARTAFLQKPFSNEELLSRLRSVLPVRE